MRQIGLIQPITVIPAGVHDTLTLDGYRIVAGHHRVAAARALGWTEIAANVLDEGADFLRLELIEIDENLCRAELTAAQRNKAVKRRKEIWEALYPTPKVQRAAAAENGTSSISAGSAASEVGGATCATHPATDAIGRKRSAQQEQQFAASTAAVTGESKSQINRQLARADALGDDLDRIVGTSLDKGVEMDALAKMAPAERAAIIERAEAGEKVSAKSEAAKTKPGSKPMPAEILRAIRELSDADLSAFLHHTETVSKKAAVKLFLNVRLAA